MTAVDFFLRIVRAFERLNIPYVTVGSFAANVYMDPRSTKDADFVLELDKTNLRELVAAIGADFRLDEQMSLESVTLTSRYKLSHRDAAFEVEFFGLSTDPHDQMRFARRVAKELNGIRIFVLTAEDVVITKLRWSLKARRTKDLEDARLVLRGQSGQLDLPYMRQWCDQHATRGLLESLLSEVEKLEGRS
jgi:hypothetical protein